MSCRSRRASREDFPSPGPSGRNPSPAKLPPSLEVDRMSRAVGSSSAIPMPTARATAPANFIRTRFLSARLFSEALVPPVHLVSEASALPGPQQSADNLMSPAKISEKTSVQDIDPQRHDTGRRVVKTVEDNQKQPDGQKTDLSF